MAMIIIYSQYNKNRNQNIKINQIKNSAPYNRAQGALTIKVKASIEDICKALFKTQ